MIQKTLLETAQHLPSCFTFPPRNCGNSPYFCEIKTFVLLRPRLKGLRNSASGFHRAPVLLSELCRSPPKPLSWWLWRMTQEALPGRCPGTRGITHSTFILGSTNLLPLLPPYCLALWCVYLFLFRLALSPSPEPLWEGFGHRKHQEIVLG